MNHSEHNTGFGVRKLPSLEDEIRQATDEIARRASEQKHDSVNHPSHYTAHPSGVECITVTEHMTFNAGNAVKYIWRAGLKTDDPVEDLRKAAWYITREIERLTKGEGA